MLKEESKPICAGCRQPFRHQLEVRWPTVSLRDREPDREGLETHGVVTKTVTVHGEPECPSSALEGAAQAAPRWFRVLEVAN